MAAIVLAAAFLLAPRVSLAATPEIPPTPVIDTSKAVDQIQCAPCHLDLGSVDVPGLTFFHGNHLMMSCDTCHSRIPHRSDTTEHVPMEVCYACHGVQHGPQGELATSECAKCHTKSFTLRPKSHTRDYARKPHADASEELGLNSCMMCHKAPKDCDACHEAKNLRLPKMPNAYANIIRRKPRPPSVKIYPTGSTKMSQCGYCHSDLDKITPGRLIFAHAAHLQRNFKCAVCHPKFGHSGDGPRKPDMRSCYRCHGVQHSLQGLVAGEDCRKCHPKSFDLVPKSHTARFKRGGHKVRAKRDLGYCRMCHKIGFCVTCHTGKGVTRNSPRKPVVPATHTDAKWRSSHGSLFLERQGACVACHDGPSCQVCHKTIMPHPPGWSENHRPPEDIPATDCRICHRERSMCQNCHHRKARGLELIQINCARGPGMRGCHVEMMQKPATDIKKKPFAEHAVHFNVKKKKGYAYRCYECHADIGGVESAQRSEAQEGHDLRLCASCHGALDPFNVEIAPYKGSSLCLRCHKNLNL